MSAEEAPPNKWVARLLDLVGILAAGGVGWFAFLVFTNQLPKNLPKQLPSVFAYFYVLLAVGVVGLLGEQLATFVLVCLYVPALILVTGMFVFKPESYPFELYQDYYFFGVVITGLLSVYLFVQLEKTKKMKGVDTRIGARVDPAAAARYRAEQERKAQAESDKIAIGPKGERTLKTKKEPTKSPIDPNETPEQRMDREMRELREEFARRSLKLGTTLIRVKNLARSLDRDQIFSTIIELVAKGVDAERLQLLAYDDEKWCLRVMRAEGMPQKEWKDLAIELSENSMLTHFAREWKQAGEGATIGAKECIADPKTSALVTKDPKGSMVIGNGRLKTLLCSPIFIDKKLFAIVNVERMKNPDYEKEDMDLISTTCDVAGLVFKNAHLYSATIDDLVSTKKVSEEQLAKNAQLSQSLSRIVSPSVAKMIMNDPSGLKLGGSKGIVTMFFSDVRGFTKMSEGMDPAELVGQLNVYFTRMTDILMSLEGTLDKYVGDELMALFGAPVARPDDPIRAVLCAVQMMVALKELQEQWAKEKKPIIRIGIGINTGEVTAGYMGSEKQLSYTVIGDNVNLAARIMANAQPGQILISRSTYELVKDYFDITQLESIMVKGKSMQIEIFQINGTKEGVNYSELIEGAKEIGTVTFGSTSGEAVGSTSAVDKQSSATAGLGVDLTKQNVVVDDKHKMLECQKCGTENDAQTKFCTKCGMPML